MRHSSDRVRVIIYCMGVAEKWNDYLGVSKYLIPIHKTSLLERTIRLVRKYSDEIVIVSLDKRLMLTGASFHHVTRDTLCFAETAWETRFLWKEDTLWLKGDVFFTRAALRRIFANAANFKAFGRMYGNMYTLRKNGEMFAIYFKTPYQRKVEEAIRRSWQNAQKGGKGRMWEIYRSLAGLPLNSHGFSPQYLEQITDLTDDIDFPEDYHRAIKLFTWDEQKSIIAKACLYWYIYTVKVRALVNKIKQEFFPAPR